MLRVRYFFFFEDFIYLFVERQEGREKERERNIDVGEKIRSVASCMPPTGDLARNPGLCPGWGLNQRPFSTQASAQSTELHPSGQGQICMHNNGKPTILQMWRLKHREQPVLQEFT